VIPEIGTMITIPSQVSSIAILLRYRKCIWNISPWAHWGGRVKFYWAPQRLVAPPSLKSIFT